MDRSHRDTYRDRDRDRESYRDRDRDRDREYRDRDHSRERDRYGGGGGGGDPQPYRRPSRFTDGPVPPPPPPHIRDSPENFRSGFGGRGGGFGSPPMGGPPSVGVGYPPPYMGPGGAGGGFRPMGSGGRVGPGGLGGPGGPGGEDGYVGSFQGQSPTQSLSGQKRGFPFSAGSGGQGGSPTGDRNDLKNAVKLFVGSVPRTAVEEDIRPLFEQHGKVMEIAFINDRRTGQRQGCCFVRYASFEEVDRAIRGLHNQFTLPGGAGPIQVRYADGERERLGNGTTEYKLFVASLNRQATEKEIEEIFARYGQVVDVYLMRDENRNSRGSGFVKYSNKDSAMAAINGLNGIFTMRGSDRPLIVRFAEPKRPRPGETRPAPVSQFVDPMGSQRPPMVWQNSQTLDTFEPSANAGVHDFGNQIPPKSGNAVIPSNAAGHPSPLGAHAASTTAGPGVSSFPTAQQGFSQPFPTPLPGSQPLSSLPKQAPSPPHFPSSMQLQPHGQAAQGYAQPNTSQEPARGIGQPQVLHSGGQTPYGQAPRAQYYPGLAGQQPTSQLHPQQPASQLHPQQTVSQIHPQQTASQLHPQQTASQLHPQQTTSQLHPQQTPSQLHPQQAASQLHPEPAASRLHPQQSASQLHSQQTASQLRPHQTASASPVQQFPLTINLQPSASAAAPNSQPLPTPSPFSLQQSSQLAEMLTQQKQSLQATLQSSQQAFSQLQQQWHMMQPSSNNQHQLSNMQAAENQTAGSRATEVTSTTLSAPVVQTGPSANYPIKCSWTEHTAPDGNKYYYNSSTGQSMWEKPEEFIIYEQQKQKLMVQQPQSQSSLQSFPSEKTPQQLHMQMQYRHTEQLHTASLPTSYQNSGAAGKPNGQDLNYNQMPAVSNVVNVPGRFSQGPQGPPASQDWMLYNKTGVNQ